LLLVFELGEEGFPVRLGLFFVELGGGLFFDDGGSDVVEEVHDFHDVFVVKLVGQLGQLGDEGLEEGGLLGAGGFGELFQDLVVSGFNLRECDTVNHVLDELDSFF
jgi:hypothetical protein